MLFEPAIFWTIFTAVAITAILVALTIYYVIKGTTEKPISGREAIEGEIGVARTDLDPEGRVLVHGEWWNARANETIPEGTKIKVVAVENMRVRVERAPEEK